MNRSRLIPIFCIVTALAAIAVPRAASAATIPSSYFWEVGTPTPIMMNNQSGYCWLTEIYKSNVTPTNVRISFNSNWNWVFEGSGDPNSWAYAECLPWSAISNYGGSNGVAFDISVNYPTGPSSYTIPNIGKDSLCNIEGVAGDLSGVTHPGTCGTFVNLTGTLEIDSGGSCNEGQGPAETLYGGCAKLRGPGPVTPNGNSQTINTLYAGGGYGTNLGYSGNQMCWPSEFMTDTSGDSYTYAGVYIDGNNNYQGFAFYGDNIYVTCVSLRTP